MCVCVNCVMCVYVLQVSCWKSEECLRDMIWTQEYSAGCKTYLKPTFNCYIKHSAIFYNLASVVNDIFNHHTCIIYTICIIQTWYIQHNIIRCTYCVTWRCSVYTLYIINTYTDCRKYRHEWKVKDIKIHCISLPSLYHTEIVYFHYSRHNKQYTHTLGQVICMCVYWVHELVHIVCGNAHITYIHLYYIVHIWYRKSSTWMGLYVI